MSVLSACSCWVPYSRRLVFVPTRYCGWLLPKGEPGAYGDFVLPRSVGTNFDSSFLLQLVQSNLHFIVVWSRRRYSGHALLLDLLFLNPSRLWESNTGYFWWLSFRLMPWQTACMSWCTHQLIVLVYAFHSKESCTQNRGAYGPWGLKSVVRRVLGKNRHGNERSLERNSAMKGRGYLL